MGARPGLVEQPATQRDTRYASTSVGADAAADTSVLGATAHQISSKSDDSRLRHGDKTIFKMAAVRHLEFSKFGILVT